MVIKNVQKITKLSHVITCCETTRNVVVLHNRSFFVPFPVLPSTPGLPALLTKRGKLSSRTPCAYIHPTLALALSVYNKRQAPKRHVVMIVTVCRDRDSAAECFCCSRLMMEIDDGIMIVNCELSLFCCNTLRTPVVIPYELSRTLCRDISSVGM